MLNRSPFTFERKSSYYRFFPNGNLAALHNDPTELHHEHRAIILASSLSRKVAGIQNKIWGIVLSLPDKMATPHDKVDM